MVEQCNGDGGTVEQGLWNSGTDIMEQQNRDGTTVDHLMAEQWNNQRGTAEYLVVEQKNDYDRTMEHLMVEQWNI